MEHKYYTEEQILEALSEVGVGAGDTSEVLSYLGRLPSAERKTGKWIRESLVTNYPYKCSACKKYSRAMYDFCPNCGAKMEVNHDNLHY